MAGDQDLAARAIGRITDILQIDNAKIVRITQSDEEGFDWWPGDFRVRVRAERSKAVDSVRLVIRTDFLKEVPVADEQFISVVDALAHLTSTYALVYPPAPFWEQYKNSGFDPLGLGPRLGFSCSAYVSSDSVSWLSDFLAQTCVMQPINAQIQSAVIQEGAGGVPDMSRPDTLKNIDFDLALQVAAMLYAPEGAKPSAWAGTGEFEGFADKCATSGSCLRFGSATGLTIETPFGDHSALIRLETEPKHPQLGHGLLANLRLPYSSDNLSTAKDAAMLNLRESAGWTDFPLLGCWHSNKVRDDDHELAFSLFIPNALYQPGLATHVALWFLERARWARETLYPEAPNKTMVEIWKSRFAKSLRSAGRSFGFSGPRGGAAAQD
jgi:hypothetical protein